MNFKPSKLNSILVVIIFLILSISIVTAEENLLFNGDFSLIDAHGQPEGWHTSAWINQENYTIYSLETIGYKDDTSVSIRNLDDNDARFVQQVKVLPNTKYKLSGYIRTEQVKHSGWGANISIGNLYIVPQGLFGSQYNWTYFESYGLTGSNQEEVEVWLRLGGYSGESSGKAYFDNISLVEVSQIPPDIVANNWFSLNETINEDSTIKKSPPSIFNPGIWGIWYMAILLFIFFTLLAYPYISDTVLKDSNQSKKEEKKLSIYFFLGISIALVLRTAISLLTKGYGVDVQCFTSWSDTLSKYGVNKFYESAGFCDYPPGYLYLLNLHGFIVKNLNITNINVFGINIHARALENFLLRFLPNISDLIISVLLYNFAKNKIKSKGSILLGLLYAFNPTTLLTTAAWGQIDSVLTLGLVLTMLFSMKKRWDLAFPTFVASILTKPQALLFGPIGLASIVFLHIKDKNLIKDKDNRKRFFFGLVYSILLSIIIIVPFKGSQSFGWLIKLYKNTLASYDYATINATNFFYLLNGNWISMGSRLIFSWPVIIFALSLFTASLLAIKRLKKHKNSIDGLDINIYKGEKTIYFTGLFVSALYLFWGISKGSYKTIGQIGLFTPIFIALVLLWMDKNLKNLPLIAAMMLIGIFTFAGKMHERYIYSAIALLFFSYADNGNQKILILILITTISSFLNINTVLFNDIYLLGDNTGHLNSDTLIFDKVLALMNICLTFLSIKVAIEVIKSDKTPNKNIFNTKDIESKVIKKPREKFSGHKMNLNKVELLLILLTTIVYAILAFTNLGSYHSPQTKWTSVSKEESIIIDTGTYNNYELLFFGGVNYTGFTFATGDKINAFTMQGTVELDQQDCFKWDYAKKDHLGKPLLLKGRFLKITALGAGLNLWEIIVRDQDKNTLKLDIIDHHTPENSDIKSNPHSLIDEQDSFKGDEPGWYNSMYFDEIYHARTGYEHANNLTPYETTHPPLGKVFMSWAIKIFGMTPFGWRFAGTLAGILMIPAIYLLIRQTLKKREVAFFAMLLMTFDLMHFTQTRIATIDSFPVIFIILAYWMMIRYMQTEIYKVSWAKRLLPLFFSGIFMGLAIASKWVGIYAGLGLAVIFFWSSWRNLKFESVNTTIKKDEKINNILSKEILYPLTPKSLKYKIFIIILIWCVVFFIIIPVSIYALSYIPHLKPLGGINLKRLIDAQKLMFTYHSKPGLGMDHYYYSPWWQWPIIGKPMYYAATNLTPPGTGATIVAMGNPLVWWGGLISLFMVMAAFIHNHIWLDKKNRILHIHTKKQNPAIALTLIGFSSQYIPWVLVPRGTYIYHYFASIPFIIMSFSLVILWIQKKHYILGKTIMILLTILALGMFIGFFPYASGYTVPIKWLEWGQWFPAALPY